MRAVPTNKHTEVETTAVVGSAAEWCGTVAEEKQESSAVCVVAENKLCLLAIIIFNTYLRRAVLESLLNETATILTD